MKDPIKEKLRDVSKMNIQNDGTRTLFESVMMPEVIEALKDLTKADPNLVLIGGIAVSYYLRPRTTIDVDVLVASDNEIPSMLTGFKKTRAHSFQHKNTHVEVEFVTPEFVNMPKNVVDTVLQTAITVEGVRIATPASLVALKLFSYRLQDRTDISHLINYTTIDLSPFHLPEQQLQRFEASKIEAEAEKQHKPIHG